MPEIVRACTVVIDSREHYPLLFPATVHWRPPKSHSPTLLTVHTKTKALDTGDYLLEGFESCCRIERKASIMELANNFTSADLGRMRAVLGRLRDCCAAPVILLEATPSHLTSQSEHALVMVRAFTECLNFGIPFWIVPSTSSNNIRRAIGELALMMMLAATISKTREIPGEKPDFVNLENFS